METGNARNGRSQPAVHYRDCVDRRPSHRQTISARAIYRSGDLGIFGERESDTQHRAKLALSRGGCEHRACHVERWPHPDQAGRLSAGQREKSGLGCRARAEIFASGRASAGTGSLRKNFGPGLVTRPAEWCASSDESFADAMMKKPPSSRAKMPVRLGPRGPDQAALRVSPRDSSTSLRMTKVKRSRDRWSEPDLMWFISAAPDWRIAPRDCRISGY